MTRGCPQVQCIEAGGAHTHGHTAFLLQTTEPPCLFAGDVVFLGGCGACFEGAHADMLAAFWKLWRRCPESTLVFPGHESRPYCRSLSLFPAPR